MLTKLDSIKYLEPQAFEPVSGQMNITEYMWLLHYGPETQNSSSTYELVLCNRVFVIGVFFFVCFFLS